MGVEMGHQQPRGPVYEMRNRVAISGLNPARHVLFCGVLRGKRNNIEFHPPGPQIAMFEFTRYNGGLHIWNVMPMKIQQPVHRPYWVIR